MRNINSPSSITVSELSRIVKDFEEKIKDGTEDPHRFLTLAEIEKIMGEANRGHQCFIFKYASRTHKFRRGEGSDT